MGRHRSGWWRRSGQPSGHPPGPLDPSACRALDCPALEAMGGGQAAPRRTERVRRDTGSCGRARDAGRRCSCVGDARWKVPPWIGPSTTDLKHGDNGILSPVEGSARRCYPVGRQRGSRATVAPRGRIRLEAQDTALSRRRSPVRIRYAVPKLQICLDSTLTPRGF